MAHRIRKQATNSLYGEYEKRTGLLDFHDRLWHEYEDYLGARPPDRMSKHCRW